MRITLPLVLLALAASTHAEAQSLRGSRASVDLMYRQAIDHDLHFYETASGVRRAVGRGSFVPLEGNRDYGLASVSHPYVLATTRTFVERLAAQYRAACGERLVVTSAVRPRSQRLVNSVAKSVHPTGMAVDLRKPARGRCLSWLRETLLHLDARGVVEATEERNPPHFHVAVFPGSYRAHVQGRGGAERLAERAGDTPADRPAGGPTYRVRRGDSLWSIARRNQVSVEQLKRHNALRSSRILAGQVLRIPSAR